MESGVLSRTTKIWYRKKEETMCNYVFKPFDDDHKIEVHGSDATKMFHAVCFDCNLTLCSQVSEVKAKEAKAHHRSIFQSLGKLEPYMKFFPRCACFTEYLDTLGEDELDATLELAFEIEDLIESRMTDGIREEAVAAAMLESELLLEPTLLKRAKNIYVEELHKLL